MRHYELLACALAACLLLAACATTARPGEAADRAAIAELRRQIRDAEHAGDASVFARVAVPDVIVMPPGAAPIQGRDATVSAMRGFFGNFDLRIDYVAAPVEIRGDTAIDHGTFTQTIAAKGGGAPQPGGGSYLWVYRRMPDGSWQQTHAIWNVKP